MVVNSGIQNTFKTRENFILRSESLLICNIAKKVSYEQIINKMPKTISQIFQ